MISLINSVFITLLFSVWIWTLKQDIGHLRQPAHDGPGGLDVEPAARKPKQKSTTTRANPALFDQHGKARNGSGVSTWTIA